MNLPIGTGKARRIVVSYPTNEGYTPGDVYELFVDDSDRIVQWVYRKGGDPKPTRITTWEDYRKVGPLKPFPEPSGPGRQLPRVVHRCGRSACGKIRLGRPNNMNSQEEGVDCR